MVSLKEPLTVSESVSSPVKHWLRVSTAESCGAVCRWHPEALEVRVCGVCVCACDVCVVSVFGAWLCMCGVCSMFACSICVCVCMVMWLGSRVSCMLSVHSADELQPIPPGRLSWWEQRQGVSNNQGGLPGGGDTKLKHESSHFRHFVNTVTKRPLTY